MKGHLSLATYHKVNNSSEMKATETERDTTQMRWSILWYVILLGLGVVHVIPLWSYTYFPTQDGPSHIYNAHAFLQLFDGGNWRLDQVFRQNIGWIPNSLAHLFFVVGQGLGFDPLLVEKIFVTMVIVGLPLSIHYLATALDPKNWCIGLIGFVLAFHNLLHMGFYSYSISVPMALVFLGTFIRWRFHLTWRRVLILNVLGFLVFLSHFSSMAILLLLLAVLMGADLIRCILSLFRFEGVQAMTLKSWLANGIVLLGVGAPALVYHLMAGDPNGGRYIGDERLWSLFLDDALLVTYTAEHYQIANWFWWLFGLGLLFHVMVRVYRKKIWVRTDIFIFMALGLGWLYFDLPNMTHGGGWVNHRPLLFLLVFLWLSFSSFASWMQATMGCLILYVSLHQLILFDRDYRMLQPMLAEYEGVAPKLEPHSTVTRTVRAGGGFPGSSLKVNPFLHAPCYTSMGRDMAYLQNYEASHRYFWVNHRHRQSNTQGDYHVHWDSVSSAGPSTEKGGYEAIVRRPHLAVFKMNEKDGPWNGEKILRLRFSETAHLGGGTRVSIYRAWKPGTIGFLQNKGLEASGGGVRSLHPNTLRMHLPAGRYRVNLLLKGRQKSTAFSLRVNDDLVYEHLEAEALGYEDSPSFPLQVTEKHTDLTFAPKWERGNHHMNDGYWALEGLDVIPVDEDMETGLEFVVRGWNRRGYFSESLKVDLVHAEGNVTYTTDGKHPTQSDELWPDEGLEISDTTTLKLTRWDGMRPLSHAKGEFTEILKADPQWFPPLRMLPPGSLEGRSHEGPLEGYLKIDGEGRYHFRSYGETKVDLGGRELPLESGEITEVWLSRGFYSLNVQSEEGDPQLFWSKRGKREAKVSRSNLWLKRSEKP